MARTRQGFKDLPRIRASSRPYLKSRDTTAKNQTLTSFQCAAQCASFPTLTQKCQGIDNHPHITSNHRVFSDTINPTA